MEKLELKDAIEYVNRVAQDATNVAIHWAFDKQMTFIGHSDFDGEYFIRCLKVVSAELSATMVKKSRVGPELPKPNIKPVGQKPVNRLSKRPIIYNDRVVGPQ